MTGGNWREPAIVVLSCLIGLGWGFSALVAAVGVGRRLLGLGAVVGALLVLASYALRFMPSLLWHDWWSRSRARRAARYVLRFAWVAFLVAGTVTGLVVWVYRR